MMGELEGYLFRRTVQGGEQFEGWVLSGRRNTREHRVIEFILPIFYPEKPNRLSIVTANTILETQVCERRAESG